jgi:lipopolysaccharide/colanic/teichoic acid biosynthesis glycosyltransferase
MGFLDILQNNWFFSRSRCPFSLRGLESPTRFHRAIARERARSDRTGDPFSLVTFQAREAETARETLARLAKILRRRVRWTDEIGWLDRQRLAVALPSTPYEGAVKIADDVCLAFPPSHLPPLCEIYCYPSDQIPGRARRHGARKKQSARVRSLFESGRRVRPMEPLFVQSTPVGKRAFDLAAAATALILLSPLLAMVALAVKFTSAGPVLFRQRRVGRGGRLFVMYKFRSMVADAESQKRSLAALNGRDGPAFKMPGDPRITYLGRWLRRTSLDELPQLWNVLRGEMSLVGPRPLPCDEADGCCRWHRERLDVAPGLTCIWQVNGRSSVPFQDWMRMDLQYIRTRSALGDIRLLLQTVWAVASQRGAS